MIKPISFLTCLSFFVLSACSEPGEQAAVSDVVESDTNAETTVVSADLLAQGVGVIEN